MSRLRARNKKVDRIIVTGPSSIDVDGTDVGGWCAVPGGLFRAVTETFEDEPGSGSLFDALYVAALRHHGAAEVKIADLLSRLGWRKNRLNDRLETLRKRGEIAYDRHKENKIVVVVYLAAQNSCMTPAHLEDLCGFCAKRPTAKACLEAVQGISPGEEKRKTTEKDHSHSRGEHGDDDHDSFLISSAIALLEASPLTPPVRTDVQARDDRIRAYFNDPGNNLGTLAFDIEAQQKQPAKFHTHAALLAGGWRETLKSVRPYLRPDGADADGWSFTHPKTGDRWVFEADDGAIYRGPMYTRKSELHRGRSAPGLNALGERDPDAQAATEEDAIAAGIPLEQLEHQMSEAQDEGEKAAAVVEQQERAEQEERDRAIALATKECAEKLSSDRAKLTDRLARASSEVEAADLRREIERIDGIDPTDVMHRLQYTLDESRKRA